MDPCNFVAGHTSSALACANIWVRQALGVQDNESAEWSQTSEDCGGWLRVLRVRQDPRARGERFESGVVAVDASDGSVITLIDQR